MTSSTWMAPPRGKEARLYRLSDLAWLLGTVVVCLLLLESEGLLTWAQRMEVSAGQAGVVSLLRSANDLLQSVGFTRPRQAAVRMGDGLAQWLGAEADPLLADGWRNPTPSVPSKKITFLASPAASNWASALRRRSSRRARLMQ